MNRVTSKKRTGSSPRLFASGNGWSSSTFVRRATLPVLEQANHVPPATASLPPNISLPSHHATGSVGLQKFPEKKERNGITIISIKYSKIHKKISIKPVKLSLPVVILISVLQEKQRIEWMSLPNKSCYAHYSIQWTCNQEIDGRRRKNLDTHKHQIAMFPCFWHLRLYIIKNCAKKREHCWSSGVQNSFCGIYECKRQDKQNSMYTSPMPSISLVGYINHWRHQMKSRWFWWTFSIFLYIL